MSNNQKGYEDYLNIFKRIFALECLSSLDVSLCYSWINGWAWTRVRTECEELNTPSNYFTCQLVTCSTKSRAPHSPQVYCAGSRAIIGDRKAGEKAYKRYSFNCNFSVQILIAGVSENEVSV